MKYNFLLIEREYASGGREIGKLVADQLKIPYYGEEILKITAEKYDVSPERLRELEESATNSVIYFLLTLSQGVIGRQANLSDEDSLALAESKVIEELACYGPAVMIGHCAGHVLQSRSDILTVFIHADIESRRKRAIDIYGVASDRVDKTIAKTDKRRSNYYQANTQSKWNDPNNYHIVLDSGRLGIEHCAKLLLTAMQQGENEDSKGEGA